MIFATDFDGVILDFYNLVVNGFLKRFKIDIRPYWKEYYFKLPNISEETIKQTILDIIDNDTINAKPIEDSIVVLKEISQITNEPILIITNRVLPNAKKSALMWSKKYLSGINYMFYFVKGSKSEVLKDHEVKYFVEDRPDYCLELSSLDCLEKIFLLQQPYNIKQAKIENFSKKIYVVENWNEILVSISEYINRTRTRF